MGHNEQGEGPTVSFDAERLLHVTCRRLPQAVVVAAAGEVDLATAEDLAAAVRAAFELRPGTVVIDLTDVRFLASTGLSVLAEADQAAHDTCQLLRVVVGDHDPVARSLAISGLADRLTVLHNRDEALRAV